ncbi:MAG TPA: hypothetical protein VFS43_31615 [Polyangiaceae bacterium]|nr:hypothetical protein [Polyangiaceae bacterium]
MNAQNVTYRGVELPAKYRRGLVRNVVALGLAFLSVGVYARASAELGLTDTQNGSAYCELSGADGVRQGPAGDTSGR